MKKSAYQLLIMMIIMMMITIVGCNKDEEGNDGLIKDYNQGNTNWDPTATIEPTIIPTVIPVETREGEMRSNLTGLWVPEEIGTNRPYAIQFNNIKTVSNQWGIGQADILYEALAEGGITRLLGIGENYTSEKIGSIRSARHYFVSLADEYNAIFIHFGRTKYAVSKIAELGVNNMDGLSSVGNIVYYRDNSIKAPHNVFTSLKKIQAGIVKKGFQIKQKKDYDPHFKFYSEDTDLTSESPASKITLKFTSYASPYFEYNAEEKLYYRFQYGSPHKDSNTGKQLTFKNIIVQFVKEWNIDKNGYQTMDLEKASGAGYYISNGKMIPITWKKNESKSWMRYYNEAGEELTINPGKTFIALFPNNHTKDVVIK